MEKERIHTTTEQDHFERYLERKNLQSKEDQQFEAGALISEIHTIDTDQAYAQLNEKINRQTTLHLIVDYFSKIAAILIVPLAIYLFYDRIHDRHAEKDRELSYQEISSPSGMRSKVVLPDGTKVWLNAGSRIRYTIPFVRETRVVDLVGEAFLDVVKNQESPLDVKFNHITVRVLGTQFNVKAFPEDRQMEVVLKEGNIRLQNENKGADDPVFLKPGQQWSYDKTTNTAALKMVDADKYSAWHKNLLVLDKMPMADVARQLERWYDIRVDILDQSLYQYKFTTVFEDEPLHRVIELLEMSSPIQIDYIPGAFNTETGEKEKSVIKISRKI